MAREKFIRPGYLYPKSTSNYIFTLLFLLYLFDYTDRLVVTSLFPFIQEDWGLTDTQLGSLVSAVYWSIVALTFPVSLLVDRWSRKRTIGLMAIVWSVATAACAFTGNFATLFMARLFIGVGEAGYAPGGYAMISGMYPRERHGWMMGLWNAAIPLGSAVGVALGGVIATHFGWRHAFGLVAIPGFIVAILFFMIRDYKTVNLVKEKESGTKQKVMQKMSGRDIIREFTTKPALLLTYLGITATVFVTTSLLTWLPTYFNRVQNLTEAQAGTKASLVMLLAIVGAPLGGFIADKWRRREIRSSLFYPAIATTLSAVFVLLSFVFLTGTIQYVALLMLGISVTSFIPGASAVTQELIHPGLRATSYAIAVIIQNLLGASTAPIVIGYISDKTNIQTAMALLPIPLVLASLFFFGASMYYKKDLTKVPKIDLELKD
ncbi:MAG: MFS transporter [Bacteroidota bacterium]